MRTYIDFPFSQRIQLEYMNVTDEQVYNWNVPVIEMTRESFDNSLQHLMTGKNSDIISSFWIILNS